MFRALCSNTNKCYAIKAVQLHDFLDRKRFRSEVQIATTLSHCENIVTSVTHFESGSTGFLVMKLMRYDLLSTLADYNSEASILRIFHQVARGVMRCHERRIAHLDIKPENILLNSKGAVRLCDFGSSHMFDEPIDLNAFGTILYRAPETFSFSEFEKGAADIWSLGVLLYVLLTGVYPFPGETEEQVVDALKSNTLDFEDLRDTACSPISKDLLYKLLQTDPSSRPTIQEVLAHPWFYPM